MLLVGPSGGGKSTLLLAIAGLAGPSILSSSRGSPSGGPPIPAEGEGSLLVAAREPTPGEDVGILFQDPESQLVMARSGDEVAFGLEERCVPTDEIWPRVDDALAAIGFRYGRDRSTAALSGGEKQRLALAGVLALRPRVLLLDEPTANLDADGARALYEALRALPRSVTVVIVEHHLELAADLVDRIVAIDGKRGVVADGPAGTLLRERRAELLRLGAWVPGADAAAAIGQRPGRDLITARDVGFRYPGDERDALDGVDVTLREQEALAVTGPNGSGKSTLLLLLGGLLRPGRGTVRSDVIAPGDPDVWRWPARELAARVGTVFQDPDHQFLTTAVRDELALGPRLAGAPAAEATKRADTLVERLRLGHVAGASPFTLSGGEKRRLSVGTALACAPRALFLDEPTYGQDRNTFIELADLLREASAAGAAICAATHERALVEAMGGGVVELGRRAA